VKERLAMEAQPFVGKVGGPKMQEFRMSKQAVDLHFRIWESELATLPVIRVIEDLMS
jgi:hypothetical protein